MSTLFLTVDEVDANRGNPSDGASGVEMRMQGVIEDLALPARYWRLRLALYSRTGNRPPAHSIT